MTACPYTLAWASTLSLAVLAGCQRSDRPEAGGPSEPAAPAATAAAAPAPSPQPPPRSPDPSGPARISFDKTTHDFGRLHETEIVWALFPFTNTGGETLIVRSVKASCGCTTASLDKREYAPGESGEVRIQFDPPGNGKMLKTVQVVTNTQPEITRLTISADVAPFLVFEPAWLQLGVLAYGVEHRPTVAVWSPDGPIEIVAVKASRPDVRPRVLSPEEADAVPGTRPQGAQVIEVVVPEDATWGGLYFGLTVEARGEHTGRTVTHETTIRVAGQLFGELRAEPDTFRFGCVPGETFSRTILLERADGRPFEILDTSVSSRQMPDALIQTKKVRPDAWEVTMTATGLMAGMRCYGDVTVTTDVPGEQTINLGMLGMVRSPD